MDDISGVGYNISHFEIEKWRMLRNHTIAIFKDQFKREHESGGDDKKIDG